jgi:hypothetical protein
MRHWEFRQFVKIWACVIAVIGCWAQASVLLGQGFVVVDTRLMLLAHPLLRQFDPVTRKFQETSSEILPGGKEAVDHLRAEANGLRKKMEGLKTELTKKAKVVKGAQKAALEEAFWQERSSLEGRIKALEDRVTQATGVPGYPGLTPYAAILPQVEQLARGIREVIKELSEREQGAIVLDIAALAPLSPEQVPAPQYGVLSYNLHFGLYQPKSQKNQTTPYTHLWIDDAKRYWAKRDSRLLQPIVYGAKDMRLEAVRSMERKARSQR